MTSAVICEGCTPLPSQVAEYCQQAAHLHHAFVVTRPDCDFLYVDVGCVQQGAAFGHRHCCNCSRHVLGAQRRAIQGIDRDIDFRSIVPTFCAMKSIGALSRSPSDYHRAVDRHLVKLATHHIHSCLIRGELVALTAQSGCRRRCPLRYTLNLKC
jgi:hypothetical protein